MVSCRRIQIDANSSPTKLNFELIKDPNIKPETLKLKDEKVENILELTGTKQEFLNRTQLSQELRLTMNKLHVIRTKEQPTKREKIFHQLDILQKANTKLYKRLKKLVMKKTNNTIKNGVQIQTENSRLKGIQMAEKHSKRC